jgi:hypothetical protein
MTAVSTTNYTISAEDGWTLVATNPAYVHVRCNHNAPWYIHVGASVPSLVSAIATGTVNITGLPVAAETVTIGGQIYTWRAAVGATANEVKIGADATASAANLAAAINLGAGSGTVYGSATTVNASVTASPAIGVVTLTSRLAGTVGNAITLTEASTNLTVSGATLTGGTDPVVGVKISENYGDARAAYEKVGATTATVYVRTMCLMM